MPCFVYGTLPDHRIEGRTLPPLHIGILELPPRPERLPRGPRRIRDGLWSAPHHSSDETGREIVAMTHADGHSIIWPVRHPDRAALLDPDARLIDTPAAWREAHAFAFHWAQP